MEVLMSQDNRTVDPAYWEDDRIEEGYCHSCGDEIEYENDDEELCFNCKIDELETAVKEMTDRIGRALDCNDLNLGLQDVAKILRRQKI